MNSLLIFTFYHKYLKYEKYYNLGNKKVLYLICTNVIVLMVLSEYKMLKWNSQHEHRQPMEQTRGLLNLHVLHVRLWYDSLSITMPVSLLGYEFDV